VKFFSAKSPSGDLLYFRFYDPRVLATFLSSCSSAELFEFFGPVAACAFIDNNGDIQATELLSTSNKLPHS
jgi:hypothetical protein